MNEEKDNSIWIVAGLGVVGLLAYAWWNSSQNSSTGPTGTSSTSSFQTPPSGPALTQTLIDQLNAEAEQEGASVNTTAPPPAQTGTSQVTSN